MTSKTLFVSKEIGEKTAVLYSFEQDAFHLEPIRDYIENNIKVSMLHLKNEFRLIAIADNDVHGDAIIEKIRPYLNRITIN